MREFYEKKWNEIGNWDKQKAPFFKKTPDIEAKIGLNWIKEYKKEGKVLDIGCGGGRNSKLFQDNNFNVTGIDYSSSAIKLAKKLSKKSKFFITDIFDYNLTTKFDVILDFGLFHHVTKIKWNNYINKILSLLKKEGLFLLYTFSTESEETFNYKPNKKNWSYKRGVYNHYFSKEELNKTFSKKFRIIKNIVIHEEGRKLKFNLTLMQKL